MKNILDFQAVVNDKDKEGNGYKYPGRGRRLKYNEPTIMVGLRLPISSANKVRAAAETLGMSVSELVNSFIKKLK